MTVEREGYDGPLTFCCDSCGEVEETHCSDFVSAMAKIKSYGWIARKEALGWHHYCKDCK